MSSHADHMQVFPVVAPFARFEHAANLESCPLSGVQCSKMRFEDMSRLDTCLTNVARSTLRHSRARHV
jgi:hypothetical protein